MGREQGAKRVLFEGRPCVTTRVYLVVESRAMKDSVNGRLLLEIVGEEYLRGMDVVVLDCSISLLDKFAVVLRDQAAHFHFER